MRAVPVIVFMMVTASNVFYTVNSAGLLEIGSFENKTFYREAEGFSHTYMEFVEFCHSHDLQPASISNHDEQSTVQHHFNETQFYRHLWLGIWDIGSEGQWHWVGQGQGLSSPVQADYSNWDPNHQGGGREENCAIIRNSDFLWVDVPCSFAAVPLCQSDYA